MILIIGGNGFVGSAFARACSELGLDHRVVTRENYEEFRGTTCELVINANGNSKKFLPQKEPLLDFDLSVRSVRQSLCDISCDMYVFLSSCDVYPDCSNTASTRENAILDIGKQSSYGFHKYVAEQCVRHAAKRHLIFRMGGFVGPGLKKNAIYDILNGGPLWLDPESRLQFLSTDVLPRIVLQVAMSGVTNETFNVCGRGTVSLAQAMAWSGNRVSVKAGAPRVHYEIDIDKLSHLVTLPESAATVQEFVRSQCGSAAA